MVPAIRSQGYNAHQAGQGAKRQAATTHTQAQPMAGQEAQKIMHKPPHAGAPRNGRAKKHNKTINLY